MEEILKRSDFLREGQQKPSQQPAPFWRPKDKSGIERENRGKDRTPTTNFRTPANNNPQNRAKVPSARPRHDTPNGRAPIFRRNRCVWRCNNSRSFCLCEFPKARDCESNLGIRRRGDGSSPKKKRTRKSTRVLESLYWETAVSRRKSTYVPKATGQQIRTTDKP